MTQRTMGGGLRVTHMWPRGDAALIPKQLKPQAQEQVWSWTG